MGKRYEEISDTYFVNVIENLTNRKLNAEQRRIVIKGASEVDLVNSGLEDTMIMTYHNIRNRMKRNPEIDCFRTAAYIDAIDKVARSYMALGIFP